MTIGGDRDPTALFAPTKFVPPEPPTTAIVRHGLQDRLARSVEAHPLTLLSAPAGSGKTVALAQWRCVTDRAPVIWVRLHPDDDDARMLATALAVGLATSAGPDAGRHLHGALSSGAEPTVRQLAAACLRDLAELDRPVVVLDDAHALSRQDALDLLSRVIDDVPRSARVIIATRHDLDLGLARRRVRGELAELRFPELRLLTVEVDQLLRTRGADPAMADELTRSSGGWAAAVALHVGTVGGGAPIVADTDHQLRAFLLEEVLDRQPDEVRGSLLRCAVLDELTPDAVSAVCGSSPAAVLDDLHTRNLFVDRISTTSPPTYRFHDLFRDFLRERLIRELPDELAELHRRAAAVTPAGEAIRHLLAAGDVDGAVDRMAGVARAYLYRGEHQVPRAWLALLPPGAKDGHPFLELVVAMADARAGRMDRARPLLDQAAAALERSGDDRALVLANHARLEVALGLGDFVAAAEIRRWFGDRELDPADLAPLLVGDVWAAYFANDWDAVAAAFDAALSLALNGSDRVATSFVALGSGADLLLGPRGPDWYANALVRLEALLAPDEPAMASVIGTLAAADLARGDLDRARARTEHALALSELNGGVAWLDPYLAVGQIALALVDDDHELIEEVADRYRSALGGSSVHRQLAGAIAYGVVRSWVGRGHPGRATPAAQPFLEAASAAATPWAAIDVGTVAGVVARAEGRTEDARRHLTDVAAAHLAWPLGFLHGFPGLELAGIALDAGDAHAARGHARPTLEWLASRRLGGLLAPEGDAHHGVLELFADHPAIGALQQPSASERSSPAGPIVVPGTGETITNREAEVLALAAEGLANRDIGTRLFIGERTVKTHMTAILRKLGATNRTEAVARARAHGLLRGRQG